MPEQLFTNQTPGITNVFENQAITVGTKIIPAVNGSVGGGRFYGTTPGNVSGTFELALWEALTDDSPADTGTGTLLNTVAFGAITPSVWNPASFSVATPVLAGHVYVIGTRTSEGRYTATGGFFNSGDLVVGDLKGPQAQSTIPGFGVAANGVYIESLTAYPNKTFNGNCYFVDWDFTPASSGLAVSVWNGTTEITGCSVSVWNGTSEVAASVGSVV